MSKHIQASRVATDYFTPLMALVTGSWIVDILLLIATLLYLLYRDYSSSVNFFESRDIPYLKPVPLFGYLGIFTKPQIVLAQDLYNSFPGERYFGYFQTKVPTLMVREPELVQRVMVKDFAHFHDRGFKSIGNDLLSKNLFLLKGQPWRSLRNKLTPTFSSGKLKNMFPQFEEISEHLLEVIEKSYVSGMPLDAKVISVDFATEVIGSTAFGLDFSKKNPQTVEFISRINNITVKGFRQLLISFVAMIAPKVAHFFRLTFITPGTSEYFVNLVKSTKDYRNKNNSKRNDYFQLLLTLQEAEESGNSKALATNDNNEDDALINQMEYVPQSMQSKTETRLLTDEGLTAQAMVFLMAGSGSVSGTLSLALYHIAKDPQVQGKLEHELKTVLAKQGGCTYQAVREMAYLDQILQETLRLYPVLPITFRECTVPYPIPGSDIVLDKGTVVAVPVAGLHMDPKYHPNPEHFNPDRFIDNNHKPSPTYMPFGDGPRICIAMRFAIMEMKIGLAKILSQYSVEINEKTLQPFTYDKKSFSPKPLGGIWINFKKRPYKQY